MAGLLGRAGKLLRGKAPVEASQPFTVRCRCGESMDGLRRGEALHLPCPACGGTVFIFPRCPLPEPSGKLHTLPVRRSRDDSGLSRPRAPESPPDGGKPAEGSRRKRPLKPPGPGLKPEELNPGPDLGQRMVEGFRSVIPPRRWFTRGRMIGAAVAIMVATSIWVMVERRTRMNLRENLVPRARAGLKALAEGKLDEARADLGFAVKALDRLREPFQDEEVYRQAFGELDIRENLTTDDLDGLFAGAQLELGPVNRRVGGVAVVFQTTLQKSSGGWRSGIVALVEGMEFKPVRLHPEGVPLFDRLNVKDDLPVTFGARLLRLEPSDEGDFWLRLDPASAVLITETRLLDELGLASGFDRETVLARQKELRERVLSSPSGGAGS